MWSAVFPGQGSQHIGMGKFLYDNFNSTQLLFEEASDAISLNFKKMCFEGDESELALTHNTQPALLLVSSCYQQVIKETTEVDFKFTAGHSVGEYASLVMAESLSFEKAIRAVRKRGELMQKAVPVGEGGMLAVLGLTPEQTQQLCAWTTEKSGFSPVEAANFNAPGQIVISGSQKALSWLQENLDKNIFSEPPRRLKLIPLKVSAPFHCSMMKPAEEGMSSFFKDTEFSSAKIPVVQNFTAKPVSEGNELKSNVIRQISSPVRWVQSIQLMKEQGVTCCLELGAGKVISGLIKKIDGELTTFNINSLEDLKEIESHV